jgi:heat shock protein HtpX
MIGRRRRGREATDDEAVELVQPRGSRRNEANTRRINALFSLPYGIWAAFLTVHGQPVLGPLAALVLLELMIAGLRLATISGSVVSDPVTAARVAPLLRDLCHRAQCPMPRLALRDDTLRAAAVRGRPRRPILVLSSPFVARLDNDELRSLIAHEVIHVVHGDLAAAYRRSYLALLCGAGLVAGSLPWVRGIEDFPIVMAAFLVGIVGGQVALSSRSRTLETRADDEGAVLAGDPMALVRSLTVARSLSAETRQRLVGRPPWRWLLAPVSWRVPTHPRLESRVDRLRQMVATDI